MSHTLTFNLKNNKSLIWLLKQNDPKIKPQAHSDYIYNKIETYGLDVDVMVEAKAKERAVQKYKEIWK